MHDLIYKLEKSLLDPPARQSAAKLNELLAEDFVEFGSSGKVYSKALIIERLPEEEPFKYELRDFKTKNISDNVVLATYVINIEGTESLRSSLWIEKEGRWQMTFHQGTKLANS